MLMTLQQEPVSSKENMAWYVFLGYQIVTEDLGLCGSAFDSFWHKAVCIGYVLHVVSDTVVSIPVIVKLNLLD